MEISVKKGVPSDFECDYSVEEKNRSFGSMPTNCSHCLIDERSKKVLVIVPPRLPGVTCQFDSASFLSLVACFKESVLKAAGVGATRVIVPPLGVKYHHWNQLQSSSAARKALGSIVDLVPDDFSIAFAIEDDESVKLWDGVLTF